LEVLPSLSSNDKEDRSKSAIFFAYNVPLVFSPGDNLSLLNSTTKPFAFGLELGITIFSKNALGSV
jgi:hypothetical protein